MCSVTKYTKSHIKLIVSIGTYVIHSFIKQILTEMLLVIFSPISHSVFFLLTSKMSWCELNVKGKGRCCCAYLATKISMTWCKTANSIANALSRVTTTLHWAIDIELLVTGNTKFYRRSRGLNENHRAENETTETGTAPDWSLAVWHMTRCCTYMVALVGTTFLVLHYHYRVTVAWWSGTRKSNLICEV